MDQSVNIYYSHPGKSLIFMKSKKDKEKTAKKIVSLISIFFNLVWVTLFWFGTCKHEDYPASTFLLIGLTLFLSFWYGHLRDEIIFSWVWGIHTFEPSDQIEIL